ncbi:MAG: tRNA (adenosine(37)-N6)-threonylcarbamoyltransferase complex transferase subunit TsaD [Sorangiineae bacterium]|nr:tRNA (adenosine(37)-N6)-threonylcarbamoyltransferase complex transferase subunit TsaD [Polyangiaceae bacterium]MEB2322236.1 tRNA (adenosine(37)-N6)-threonylcarbamoyltransferase complex transferase subunit TsaD [Sorangiineae bacterium]
MTLRVLGLETSCDETAAAVVTDSGEVLSDVVHSQVELHAPYGGVVPELASRDHLTNARPVIEAALARAGLTLAALDGVAVTCRPGLSGALLVGVEVAQGLAWAAGKPIVGVDHLVGHLLAVFLRHPGLESPPALDFPFVALLASGGHTALYRVDGPEHAQIRELGATRDDAAGEAYDKVAKLLGLGYPGGPVIDRLAHEGDPSVIELARPMPQHASLEFSFSGLKTNVMRWVAEHGHPGNDAALRDLCAAFQRRVVDTLVGKLLRAAEREGVRSVVLAGGVAANRELRARAAEAGAKRGLAVVVPPFRSCTDNAAMIAYAGSARLRRGEDDTGKLEVSPRSALLRVTRKGRGERRSEL